MTRVFRGILLGGGKSNEIVNNVFIDSVITITADNRGETWAAESNGTTMRNRLFNDSLDIRNSDIWLSRFPYLEELINEYDEDNYIAINAPTNNIIKNNIKCNTLINMIDNSVKRNGDVEMITEYQAYEIFENAEEDNYSFKSSFASTDFENIDFEKIGLKE